ncbi:hypothetical protein [Rhizobium acidisoli]|uniref:hypothetical protein n=1 Tax=Rhizobium acidisoli TaxID=1538158 RepID=UPI002477F1E4|nr:hypothetical protein [Rhizobium acidisoli]
MARTNEPAAVQSREGAPDIGSSALGLSGNLERGQLTEHSLIILLHGIGASGAQLMPLASSWITGLPNARFAAPDAPFHHHRYGHQWFSVEGQSACPRPHCRGQRGIR